MRKTKSLTLEGRKDPVTVHELTVRQLIDLSNSGMEAFTSLTELQSFLSSEMLPKVTTVTYDQLMDFAPSELETLWEAFKEVNKSFFDFAKGAGLTAMLEKLQEAMLSDFSKLLVLSSNPAILESSTTESPSSS